MIESAPPKASRPLRVGFVTVGSAGWSAGTHYLKNLFLAIKSLHAEFPIIISLLVPHESPPDGHTGLQSFADEVLFLPQPPPQPALWNRALSRLLRRVGFWLNGEPPLASYLHEQQVDAVFAPTDFGPRFSIPVLCWIPDFQHLRLPEMFSREAIRSRNRAYAANGAYATRIVLSSRDAARDFQAFAPKAADKVRVLPFVVQVPDGAYDSDPAWICDHYQLPRRFIYLPNQFWKHKNHTVVVQALQLAKAKNPEITIVCTGLTRDNRDPRYFPQLSERMSAAGVEENMVILGMIPHDHVFQLIRQCVALLQPSRFEGWSTSVEEAKSIGKASLLSDIPVHREQNPPAAAYFAPDDPEELARCLLETFAKRGAGPDHELETAARRQLPHRTREFAQTFIRIVTEALPAARLRGLGAMGLGG